MKKYILFCFTVVCLLQGKAQEVPDTIGFFEPSPVFSRSRTMLIGISEGVALTTSYIWLNQLWYANYPKESFHFYNDFDNWLQMDKMGHAMTAYYLGYVGKNLLDWAGVPEEHAIWWGGSLGLIFLTGIEFLDGFSEEWGFSKEDMFANIAGTALFIAQEDWWSEQRVVFKYSYHPSPYAEVYPALLGSSAAESWLKDYNGQTYWLSANVRDFINWEIWPSWLNVAVGYGADGMVTSFYQEELYRNNPQYKWQRQFYFSLDIDLRKIPVKSKFLKTVFKTLNFIKFPMPTLEINSKSPAQFYWLYF